MHNGSFWQSFSRYILLPILISKLVWMFMPLMFIAATPVSSCNKIFGFSGFLSLYIKTFVNDIRILLIICDLPTRLPPVKNIKWCYLFWYAWVKIFNIIPGPPIDNIKYLMLLIIEWSYIFHDHIICKNCCYKN